MAISKDRKPAGVKRLRRDTKVAEINRQARTRRKNLLKNISNMITNKENVESIHSFFKDEFQPIFSRHIQKRQISANLGNRQISKIQKQINNLIVNQQN